MNEHNFKNTSATTPSAFEQDTTDATTGNLDRVLNYSVIDCEDDKVGTVEAIWQDHTGQPAYVGVRTGWLGLGKTHVLPAQSIEVSDSTRKIRLPYTSDAVKDAPTFDDQYEINEEAEQRIAAHYSRFGYTAGERTGVDQPLQRPASKGMDRTTEDEVRMPLKSEELKVGKRQVEVGGVRLRKIVRTETVNQPVELQREEIVVERVPAGEGVSTTAEGSFREEEVFVPLRREEAVIEKTARTTEEVRVGKKRETERRDIKDTVRREDVEIERKGDAGKNKTR